MKAAGIQLEIDAVKNRWSSTIAQAGAIEL
jgi:hypothetical protein